MISVYQMVCFKSIYLFLAICSASFMTTDLLPLGGLPRKCGNLTIPYLFGISSHCYFCEDFHKFCNRSFEPPFLRRMSTEVLISLELLDSSAVEIEGGSVSVSCHAAQENGCRDIDHCSVFSPCVDVCINLPGGFKCYCPKGLLGDGMKNGSGCYTHSGGTRIRSYLKVMMAKFSPPKGAKTSKMRRPMMASARRLSQPLHTQDQINIWSLFVFLIVIIIIAINYGTQIATGEKRRQTTRSQYFQQNGGILLQSKLRCRSPKLEIYPTDRMDLITNFNHEVAMLRCNPGEKFYHGTITTDDAITAPVHVLVVTVNRVPESKLKDFVRQLLFLSKPHANVMRVLGCCLDKQSPVIVYELHGDGNTALCNFTGLNARLPRETWVRAAAGAAKGLAHLNSNKTTSVHGSICSANIMMNNSHDPKIFYAAGSNLMSPAPVQQSDLYADPNPRNKRRDVYSFGVVLVELLTAGMEISQNSILRAQANRLLEILDQDIMNLEGVEFVEKVARLAHDCLNARSDKRPRMNQVSKEVASWVQMA